MIIFFGKMFLIFDFEMNKDYDYITLIIKNITCFIINLLYFIMNI